MFVVEKICSHDDFWKMEANISMCSENIKEMKMTKKYLIFKQLRELFLLFISPFLSLQNSLHKWGFLCVCVLNDDN